MTTDCFDAQIHRLRNRFGDHAFDSEFVLMMGKEVATLSNYDFSNIVGMFIGNRKYNNPPLIVDFREARLQVEKAALNKLTRQAESGWSNHKTELIENILERQGFPGCKTLHEAIEVQITKNRIEEADKKASGE